jgi:hypothetical protein
LQDFLQAQSNKITEKVHAIIEAKKAADDQKRQEQLKVEKELKEESTNLEIPDKEPARKKSSFGGGLKSMLNHLTKARPKPKRGSNNVLCYNLGIRPGRFFNIVGGKSF